MKFLHSNLGILLAALMAAVVGLLVGQYWNPLQDWLTGTESGQAVAKAVLNGGAETPPGLHVVQPGEALPDIELSDLKGNPQPLADTRGRPLLINFWASWCPPCVEELPLIDDFALDQGEQGIQVVGVALDDPKAVADFLSITPVSYRILIDIPGARDSSVQLGNPRGLLPFSVLIGADGKMIKQHIGPFAIGQIEPWAAEAAPEATH